MRCSAFNALGLLCVLGAASIHAAAGFAQSRKLVFNINDTLFKSLFAKSFSKSESTIKKGGTTVSGVSYTLVGEAAVEFIDNDQAASLQAQFHGDVWTTIRSNTDASHGIHVGSVFQLHSVVSATQTFTMNAHGISHTPVNLGVITYTRVEGINVKTTGPFKHAKERIASRRAPDEVMKQRPNVDKQVTDEIRTELTKEIDKSLRQSSEDAWRQIDAEVFKPLKPLGYGPDSILFRTQQNRLVIEALDKNPDQGTSIPISTGDTPETEDVKLELHQDFARVIGASILEGKVVDDRRLVDLFTLNFGRKVASVEAPKFRIYFADKNAFSMSFPNDQIEMVLRTKKFEKESETFLPMNLKVRYAVEKRDGKYFLKRLGDLLIYPPRLEGEHETESDDLEPEETMVKIEIRNILKEHLKKEFQIEEFELPLLTRKPMNISIHEFFIRDQILTVSGQFKMRPPSLPVIVSQTNPKCSCFESSQDGKLGCVTRKDDKIIHFYWKATSENCTDWCKANVESLCK